MSSDIGDWYEQLIEGDVTGDVAFTSVLANRITGDLLITQYDRRAMPLRRYEWAPAHSHAAGAVGPTTLTISDWDGQQIARRDVAEPPAPPRDRDSPVAAQRGAGRAEGRREAVPQR